MFVGLLVLFFGIVTTTYAICPSLQTDGCDNLTPEEEKWMNKPVLVNIQLDVDEDVDKDYVYTLLNEIEQRQGHITVYFSGEFAYNHPDVVKDVYDRKHQVAVKNWNKEEDLTKLSYEEQLETINKSFMAIRTAVQKFRPAFVADFRPQNFKQNNNTFRVLQELGVRSNSGFVGYNGTKTHPYHTDYNFIAIPIATVFYDNNEFPLIDSSLDKYIFKELLIKKFNENNKTKEPMTIVVHASIVSDNEKFMAFVEFLDYVINNNGNIVMTDFMTTLANPYIASIRISNVPSTSCTDEEIQMRITTVGTCYCPMYYYIAYGKYLEESSWKVLGSHARMDITGYYQFSIPFTIPQSTIGDKYVVRVVGRACHGTCWPTAYNYEAMDEVSINVGGAKEPWVLVHGWKGSSNDWSNFREFLDKSSIPYQTVDLSPVANPEIRSKQLERQIEMIKALHSNDCRWGGKINLICHSQGGLDCRAYLRNMKDKAEVEDLVMIATPNHGSALGNLPFTGKWWQFWNVGRANWLTPGWVESFNKRTKVDKTLGVNYYTISGDLGDKGPPTSATLSGGDDGIVPEKSVHLDGATHLETFPYGHNELLNKEDVFNTIKNKIDPPYTEDLKPLAYIKIKDGKVLPSQTITDSVILDQLNETSFILASDRNLSLYLKSPSGIYITPKTTNSNISYSYNGETDALFQSYTIQNPFIGNWSLYINESTQSANFTFLVSSENDLFLNGYTSKYAYRLNENVTITANLSVKANISRIEVEIIKPNDSKQTILLYDNGLSHDNYANDGLYGNVFTPNMEDEYKLIFSAEGNISNKKFSRSNIGSIVAFSDILLFNKVDHEETQDINTDTFYDYLHIVALINVTEYGNYSVYGILNYNEIEIASSLLTVYGLQAGIRAVNLSFDGKDIFVGGINGKYTLTVYFVDSDGIEVGGAERVYNTSYYNYTRFSPTGKIFGIVKDSNGSGVPNASIYLTGNSSYFTYTNESGAYLFSKLKGGNYNMQIVPPSNLNLLDTSTTLSLQLGQIKNINFTLNYGGIITGVIKDYNHLPVPNLSIKATNSEITKFGYTNQNGSYNISGLKSGIYDVYVDVPANINLVSVLTSAYINAGKITNLNFTLQQGGTLKGFVKRENGSAIANARIEAGEYPHLQYKFTYSTNNGSYEIKGLDGTYDISVIPPPGENLRYYATPYGNGIPISIGSTTYKNFTLYLSGRIYGFVKDENNNSIANAYIELDEMGGVLSTYSNLDGSYEFIGLDTKIESYVMIATPPPLMDYLAPFYKEIFFDTIKEYNINITLGRRSNLTGIVTDLDGNPVEDVYIEACPPLEEFDCKDDYTNEYGSYELIDLGTGEYILSADPPGNDLLSYSTTLNIPPGKAIHFNITLNKNKTGYVFSGYVFGVYNNPLQVGVEIEDMDGNIGLITVTNKSGYFEFVVPTGYYEIEINDEDPILWNYTVAEIGDYTPMIDVTKDMQINFTLWRVSLVLKTNTSTYRNGDVIGVNVTVKNNEIYKLENWELGAELYFENETYDETLDEVFYLVNLSPGEKKSFLLPLKIPNDNPFFDLYLDTWIWTDKMQFKSSNGLLQGEMWQGDWTMVIMGNKTKFYLNLSKGWNLFSIPILPVRSRLPEALTSIGGNYSGIYTYIGEMWYSYLAGEPPTYKELDPTKGFWINMLDKDTLEIEGYLLKNPDIELNSGWNLIGYPYLNKSLINQTLKEVDYSVAYTYNGTWSSYVPNRKFNTLTIMKPGYGYWVRKK